jgi:hypothetical protein
MKTSTVLVVAGALVATGAGGYLLAEIRHVDAPLSVVLPEAPAEAIDLLPAVPPAEQLPVERPEPELPVAAPARPETAAPSRAEARPQPVEPPPPPVEPPAVPAVSTAPVSTMPDTLGGLGAIPMPPLTPPVERVELVVEPDSVLGVRLDEPLSSATAKVEDPVVATVMRDVLVGGRTAIPAGSRVEGYVTFVEPGGKFKEKARIGVDFSTLVLPGNERVRIETETIFREGESPTGEAASKIGAGAVVGSVLGAIIGGKKGAAIGGAAGAAGGTAVVAKGGTNDATIAAGTLLTLRLTAPVIVTVERR